MRHIWILLLSAYLLGSMAIAGPLRIGVVEISPFVIAQGGMRGIAVDLWTQIAANHALSYKYIPISQNIVAEIEKLKSGELDMIIGPIAFTYNRAPDIEMSDPYMIAHMGLLVGKKRIVFWQNLQIISRHVLDMTLLIGVILFFLIIHLIWWSEKGRSETIPQDYRKGIGYLFWRHLFGQFGDIPKTISGRLSMLSWFIAKSIITSSIIAVIISSVTLSYTGSIDTISPDDVLSTKRIACITGGPAALALKGLGINCIGVPSFEAGAKAVEAGEVDGFSAMAAAIGYYLRTNDIKNVHLSSIVLQNDAMAFALPRHSPYRHLINNELALLRENGFASQACSLYLPRDLIKNCVF